MSTPFRYDWRASVVRIEEAGEIPASFCLYCLPKAGALVLGALLERLRWRATFSNPDYELSATEWEDVQDIIDDTEVGLMANCDALITDIVSQVTTNINNTIVYNNAFEELCCLLEEVPATPLTDPPPSETDPGAGTEAGLRCARAQEAMDGGEEFLLQVLNYAVAGGAITASALALIIGGLSIPFLIPAVLIGALAIVIVGLSLDDDLQLAILQQWGSLTHDIACCLAFSESAQAAKTCINSAIDSSGGNALVRELFKIMWSQNAVNQVWDGDGFTGVGYSQLFCNDCQEGEFVGIRFQIDEYTTTATGDNNNGFGYLSLPGTDDFINNEGRVNKVDLAQLPRIALIKNNNDLPNANLGDVPGYSTEWRVFGDVRDTWTVPRTLLGIKNGACTCDFHAVASTFEALIKLPSGAFVFVPATITGITVPSGITVGGGVITCDFIDLPQATGCGTDDASCAEVEFSWTI